jgi:hypothetical protein
MPANTEKLLTSNFKIMGAFRNNPKLEKLAYSLLERLQNEIIVHLDDDNRLVIRLTNEVDFEWHLQNELINPILKMAVDMDPEIVEYCRENNILLFEYEGLRLTTKKGSSD